MTEGSGSILQNLKLVDPDPGGPKTYGSDKSGSRSAKWRGRLKTRIKFSAPLPLLPLRVTKAGRLQMPFLPERIERFREAQANILEVA